MTRQPKKSGNYPRPGPEVVRRKKVTKEQAAQSCSEQNEAECKESVALFALSIKQQNFLWRPALNIAKKFCSCLRKPLCTNTF